MNPTLSPGLSETNYPDLFQVVTKSHTNPKERLKPLGMLGESYLRCAPGCSVHCLPLVRLTLTVPLSSGQGPWDVQRSAVDVLYGTTPVAGYLTSLNRPNCSGWFFHVKKMPVKYLLFWIRHLGGKWVLLHWSGLGSAARPNFREGGIQTTEIRRSIGHSLPRIAFRVDAKGTRWLVCTKMAKS